MNATMEQTRIYTRDEQMSSLRSLIENNRHEHQRTLARVVWQSANGHVVEWEWVLGDDSFQRDAAALKGVPLATVYNRIRRILGLIK